MNCILEEIYYIFDEGTPIEGDSMNIIDKVENKFCKKLKGKEKELFYDYTIAYAEFASLCSLASFKKGFNMGFKFANELSDI